MDTQLLHINREGRSMTVSGFSWRLCCVLMLAAAFAACGSDASGNVSSKVETPAGAKPPSGKCKAGSSEACTGEKCKNGTQAIAACSVAGKYGECICHAATKAKPDAGIPADDTETSGVWSLVGYAASNSYFNPDESTLTVDNVQNLSEKWRFTVAGFPTGSPAVAEGKVFVTATGGVYALSFATGKMIWERDDIMGTASPAYEDGAIYVHTTTAYLYKLKASDGTTLWGPIHSYALASCDGTSSPILADGKVLVGHSCGGAEVSGNDDQAVARGGVEAFSTEDGSSVWTYYTVPESGENGAMVWSSVAVDLEAGVVFAATGNNYTMSGEHSDSIHAIDLASGERKWFTQVRTGDTWSIGSNSMNATGPDDDFGANPVLAEVAGQKIVADGDKGSAFWALDRETGQILWNRPALSATRTASNGGVLNNGAFDGSYFYVVANEPPDKAFLHALDPSNMGADAWDPQMIGTVVWGSPTLANGVLVVPAGTALNIYNAKTGEQLTSFETGGSIAGAAAIVDGKIIVKSGLQYVFAPDAMNNNQVICYGL
jgi:outer membrane protein assembly factor BamB